MLVGREHELATIERLLDAVEAGTAGTLVVTGEAGIGKSALLGELMRRSDLRGMSWVYAAATEYERGQPLGLLRDLLGGDADELTGVLDRSDVAGPAWLGTQPTVPEQVLDSVAIAVERRAARPTVIVADDVQWADAWSLQTLRRVARLVPGQPLLLTVAVRTPMTDPELVRLHEQLVRARAHQIHLEALAPNQVRSLAVEWLGGEPGPRVRRLLERAGGHPLYLTELLRGLEGQVAPTADGRIECERPDLPRTVGDAVRWRMAELEPATTDLLRHAAVFGSRFDLVDVASLLKLDVSDLVGPLTRATQVGLLVDGGDHLRFAHDVVREVIELDVPGPARRELHRGVAEVLARRGRPETVVARHLAGGLRDDDAEAAEQVVRTAERGASSDPVAALDLLDVLIANTTDPTLRTRAERARAEPLAWAGRVDEAIDVLLRTLDSLTDPDVRARHRWLLAGLLVARNRSDEAAVHLADALEETHVRADRARMLAEAALVSLAAGRCDEAASIAADAAEAGETAADALSVSLATSVRSRLAAYRHDYDRASELARTAVQTADTDASGYAHRLHPWFFAGLTAFDADDDQAVATALHHGLRRIDELGAEWARPLFAALAASRALRQGRLDDAGAHARDGVDLAEDTGSVAAIAWCLAIEGHVALYRDEIDRAEALLTEGERYFTEGRALLGFDFLHRGRGLLQARAGDVVGAVATLRTAWDLTNDLGILTCRPVLAPDLVVLAGAAGDHGLADTVAGVTEQDARDHPAASLIATAGWCRGLADRDPVPVERAVHDFDRAPRALDAALASTDFLALLLLRGRHDEAERYTPGVVERLEHLDLRTALGRVDRLREQAGLGPSRDQGGGDGDRWGSLTPTERAVAELVGGGLTNAEIAHARGVSIRTVETHLHRVYSKLDVGSRTQLAVAAARRVRSG